MGLDEVYKQYFNDIYHYVYSLSGNGNISEEITQETFFKALKAIDKYDGVKDIRAWLFSIAKNTYFSYYKKARRSVDFEEKQEVISGVSFEEKIIDAEVAFRIHQYVHSMKEPYKEVFTLRVFGELPFEKIGALFGKSSGWARVIFHRAKEQIVKKMEAIENAAD